MFLRNLSREEIKTAIRSCESRIREIKKSGSEHAKEQIHNEWVKMTVLMMRLEHPATENVYSLICPTCHEEWDYNDNDTHRFRCCPNCGRWFGKAKNKEVQQNADEKSSIKKSNMRNSSQSRRRNPSDKRPD